MTPIKKATEPPSLGQSASSSEEEYASDCDSVFDSSDSDVEESRFCSGICNDRANAVVSVTVADRLSPTNGDSRLISLLLKLMLFAATCFCTGFAADVGELGAPLFRRAER